MPESENADPLPANPEAKASIAILATLEHAITVEQQQGLIASAGVRAQLAVAYELNTIGRILALQQQVHVPVRGEEADTVPSYQQHNVIVERLGL